MMGDAKDYEDELDLMWEELHPFNGERPDGWEANEPDVEPEEA